MTGLRIEPATTQTQLTADDRDRMRRRRAEILRQMHGRALSEDQTIELSREMREISRTLREAGAA
jgi:hypothetical protein